MDVREGNEGALRTHVIGDVREGKEGAPRIKVTGTSGRVMKGRQEYW